MALVVEVRVTTRAPGLHYPSLDRIETLVIRRLEQLHHPQAEAADETHRYSVETESGTCGEFDHRYGDGALRCIQKAIDALETA